MSLLETLAHSFSTIASIVAILTPAAAAAAGYVPRVGPGRAMALAASCRLLSAGTRVSQRDAEVTGLRRMTRSAGQDQYCVVVGPKGVGKTCIVNTATTHAWGVVRVRIAAGTPHDSIVKSTLLAVTRSNLTSMNQEPDAMRVAWWHHLLFRMPLTVVLQAVERAPGKEFAEISGAARTLLELGVRVIVDASHNALSDEVFATKREHVLTVEPMSRALLESIPQLQALMLALKSAGLDDLVWEVVGGNPADYFQLESALRATSSGIRDVVATTLYSLINNAIAARDAALMANEGLSTVFSAFTRVDAVPRSDLHKLKLVRPSPDKVLRTITRAAQVVLVPATQPMAVVLRHQLQVCPLLPAMQLMLVGGSKLPFMASSGTQV